MSRRARIAVIGLGLWATTAHIPTLKQPPKGELIAIADHRPETLTAAA